MFLSLFYNKYGATILAVVGVMAYCYIFKPASLFDEKGNLKSKFWTPELVALLLGLCTYFAMEFLTRASPQEVVVVGSVPGGSGGPGLSADPQSSAVNSVRRADSLMSTPFSRRRV